MRMWQRRWRAVMLVSSVTLALAACGSEAEEPTGLSTGAPETAEPTADVTGEPQGDVTEDPADEPGAETSGEPEPAPTFTQPYVEELMGEESIVALRDEIPIDLPDDLNDDETDAVRAFGQYNAVVEQQLWGVPFDEEVAASVATGERLAGMREYAEESLDRERVSVGRPFEIYFLEVEIGGDEARLAACVHSGERATVADGGDSITFDDSYYIPETDLVREDDGWLVSRVSFADDTSPCEEFE